MTERGRVWEGSRVISIGEALHRVLGAVRRIPAEELPLDEIGGRVLAEEVCAPVDVPGFANSQMDGFAVRAADLVGAGRAAPATLRLVGRIAAGASVTDPLAPRTAARIMTGAPLPAGADAVVPIEEAEIAGDVVRIAAGVSPGRFVRPAGEDVRKGEVVLREGRLVRPADVGLLASLGVERVRVARRPRVAILGTGDEVVPVGQPLAPGQIHDSNAYTLAAAVAEAGGCAERAGLVRDEPDALRAALSAVSGYDVVLSTGGVSVGDFDYVKDVMEELGLVRLFWRVAQKPGKPITCATGPASLYFGLPGNPVSALVCFLLYVGPALRAAQGRSDLHPPAVQVTVGENVRTARDLTELVRCTLEREGADLIARPTGSQSSGVLRSLSLADVLVISPPGHELFAAGDRATALYVRERVPLAERHPFD